MDNISLGLKRLIFSKRDASATASSPRSGRERSRVHKFGKSRPRRDSSPFEEVKADTIEMVEKTEGDFDEEKTRDQQDGYNEDTGYRPRDMSGFEEIDWPEVDGGCEKPSQGGSEREVVGSGETTECSNVEEMYTKEKEADSPDGLTRQAERTDKVSQDRILQDKVSQEVDAGMAIETDDSKGVNPEVVLIRPVMSGTPSMSESIEAELDDVEWRAKAERHEPITREQFMGYFDSDGRIVDENELRRTIFKGGVEQDIRKEVWQFLYDLYPCNSTTREREVMKTEHRIRYEALKARWHPVLKQISQDLSLGVHFCPEWLRKKKSAKQLHYEEESCRETIAEVDENNSDRISMKEAIRLKGTTVESPEIEREIEEDTNVASEDEGDVFVEREGAESRFDRVANDMLIETENIEHLPPDITENLNGKVGNKTGVALYNEAVAEVHGRTSEDIKEAIQDAMMEEPRGGKSRNIMVTANETVTGNTQQERAPPYSTKADHLPSYNGSNNVEKLHLNSKPLVQSQDEADNMESNVSPVTTNGFYYVETADLVSPREGTSVPKASETKENERDMLTLLESQHSLIRTRVEDVFNAKIHHDQISSCDEVENTEVSSPFFQETSSDLQEVPEKDDIQANGIKIDLKQKFSDTDLCTLTDYHISNAEASTVKFNEHLMDFQESEKMENDEEENVRCEGKENSSDFSGTEGDIDTRQEEIVPINDLFDSMKNHGINPFQEIDTEVENSLFESQEQELCFGESEDESINTSALDEDLYSRTSPRMSELTSTGVNPFEDSTPFLEESRMEISENFYPEVSNTEVDLSTLQRDIDVSLQDNTVLSEFMSRDNIEQFDESLPEFDDVYGTERDTERPLVDLGTDNIIGHVNNADQLHDSGTGFRYTDEQLDLIAFSPIEHHTNALSCPKTEHSRNIEVGNLSPIKPHPERLDLMTLRPENLERDVEGRRNQGLEVASFSPITPFPEQRSKVASRPDSLDFASPRDKQPEQVGTMPPWLAQQLKASSPAGTKIKKTIHIHEGGVSSEEDNAGIVSLKEIAEKANLEVRKRLIEQGNHVPRSSTPVEFSKTEVDEGDVCEETKNQKQNVDFTDGKGADLGDKWAARNGSHKDNGDYVAEAVDKQSEGANMGEKTSNGFSSRGSHHATDISRPKPRLNDNKFVETTHKNGEIAKEPLLDGCLITGTSSKSNEQIDGENTEHGVRFGNEVLEGTKEIVDPETGEFKDEDIKPRPREKRSYSKRSGSVGEILESTDQVIPRITEPKNYEKIRKSYSTANLRDFPRTDSPEIGTFNLLKNLDESISKSDSDVYKADQRRAPSPYRDVDQYKHESCRYCCGDMERSQDFPDSFGDDLKQYIEIQAKICAKCTRVFTRLRDQRMTYEHPGNEVNAGRQVFDVEVMSQALRIIDKDVPRTDRELPYFKGNENPNLLKLRDALITYSFYHPDVGYAQGMNDVMSRFFVVMESEAEAYWMFCNYMEHFKGDFMEKDMLRKISLVEQLLMKMDRELYDFLQELQMELIFCHRWLLLSFKREFSYDDGLRVFEIMSSRHLEVSSVEAEMERSRERARELEKDEGSRMEEIYVSPEYSFDVFVCVAMLHECRDILMSTNDMANIYQIMTSLPQVNDLDTILSKAEDLFFKYCRKSTMDCFQLIDEEPAEKILNWKQRLHLDF